MGKTQLLLRHRKGHFALACLCLAPVAFATYQAVVRITTYKHHVSDINAGW
jgi:hypothetical protein